jgi:hypothetical protein
MNYLVQKEILKQGVYDSEVFDKINYRLTIKTKFKYLILTRHITSFKPL